MSSAFGLGFTHSSDDTGNISSKRSNAAPGKAATGLGSPSDVPLFDLPPSPVPLLHSQPFASSLTPREGELQKLLAEERKRSDQRRANYNALKAEHLKLQNEYLGLQAEMKQILEETIYVKDKKKEEVEQLIRVVEEKTKQIEKLEKSIRDNDPELIRVKLLSEFEDQIRRLERDLDRVDKEREKSLNELKLARQHLEHVDKEHLDAMEKIKLSYEAEVNVVRREKEEVRARLVEASQVPDVKRLVELSEENARLVRKLNSAHVTIEQSEQRYRQIQGKIEEFVAEQDQREKVFEGRIKALGEQIEEQKSENKLLKSEVASRKIEIEDLLNEIGQLRRHQDKLKLDASQQAMRHNEEREEMRLKCDKEVAQLRLEKSTLHDEIKKLRLQIEAKEETIGDMERAVAQKEKEWNEKAKLSLEQESERVIKLEFDKKQLDNSLKEVANERRLMKTEIDKLRKLIEQQNDLRLSQEREIMLLRTKVDSQASSIEDLEKVRRQHLALHDEVNRLRAERYDLLATNKEVTRINQNQRDEVARLKQELEEERRVRDECRIEHEKAIGRITRRFEEERTELRDRLVQVERENQRLRTGKPPEPHIALQDYSRLKARQFARIADRLDTMLEQLRHTNSAKSSSDSKL